MAKKQKRLWLIKVWSIDYRTYEYIVYCSDHKPVPVLSKEHRRWVHLAWRASRILRGGAADWERTMPHMKLRAGRVRELVRTKNGLTLKRGG